jgi:hypothetical protein
MEKSERKSFVRKYSLSHSHLNKQSSRAKNIFFNYSKLSSIIGYYNFVRPTF